MTTEMLEVPTVSLAQLPDLPYGELLKLPEALRCRPEVCAAIRRGEQRLKLLQGQLANFEALVRVTYVSGNSRAVGAHRRSVEQIREQIAAMGVPA